MTSSTAARSPSVCPASTGAAAVALKAALADGRAETARRLGGKPYAGTETASAYAFLTDQILRLAFDYVTERLHPLANLTNWSACCRWRSAAKAAGRWRPTRTSTGLRHAAQAERLDREMIEAILYLLWDPGLKVGHSTARPMTWSRSRRRPHVIRTGLLERALCWGDEALYDEVQASSGRW